MVSLRSAKFTPAPEMVIDIETEKDASADSPTFVLNEEDCFVLYISPLVHPSQCSYLAHELIVWYQGQEASMLLPFSYAVASAIGAIFSATDSVCTLQVLNQDDTPLLPSLVFGEGVVNDAMFVVLFNVIQRFDLTNINSTIALEFAGNFFYLFILSTSLGVAAGLLSAFIMKNLYIGRHSTDREVVHIYAIVCICINVHGLNIYFWLSFIPAILVILVGTKLEHVVWKLALEVKEQQTCTTNGVQVKPRDILFWFGKLSF